MYSLKSNNLTGDNLRNVRTLLDKIKKLNREQLQLIESNICTPLRESLQANWDARLGRECVETVIRKHQEAQKIIRALFKEEAAL